MLGVSPGRIGRVGSASPVAGVFDLDAFMAAQTDGLYNRFDLTDRLFQENVGPTPADDAGEVIGLALGQRLWGGKTLAQVLAAQAELVTNGGFDSDTAWSKSAGAVISGGVATIMSADGSLSSISQNFTAVVGAVYQVEFDLISITGAGVSVDFGVSNTNNTMGTALGRRTIYLKAGEAGAYVSIKRTSGITTFTIDNVSVKLVPGNHALQATTNYKPKYQTGGGALFDGFDDNLLTSYVIGAGANFIVAKVTVPETLSGTQIITGMVQSGANAYIGVATSGQLRVNVANAAFDRGPDLRGQAVSVGFAWDGTNLRSFVIDQVYETLQSGTPTTASPIRIGSGNSAAGIATSFFGGIIHSLAAGREFIDLTRFKQIASKL